MEEIMTNAPICKTVICKRPLTYLEDSKCWRCLACNPIRKTKPEVIKAKSFLDVKMTDKRVIELIQEHVPSMINRELENWHIQKPPIMQDEIEDSVTTNNVPIEPKVGTDINSAKTNPEETYLQKAKRLGVRTHNEHTGGMRKKADVMEDTAKQESGDEEL